MILLIDLIHDIHKMNISANGLIIAIICVNFLQ